MKSNKVEISKEVVEAAFEIARQHKKINKKAKVFDYAVGFIDGFRYYKENYEN